MSKVVLTAKWKLDFAFHVKEHVTIKNCSGIKTMKYKRVSQHLFGYQFVLTLIFLLIICSNLFHFRIKNSNNCTESQYQSGMIQIQRYLFHLNNACRHEKFDIAQNTFLDLLQHWQRQDLLFKSIQRASPLVITYLPSDSLATLEKYLNQMADSSGQQVNPEVISKEIQRITDKIDHM